MDQTQYLIALAPNEQQVGRFSLFKHTLLFDTRRTGDCLRQNVDQSRGVDYQGIPMTALNLYVRLLQTAFNSVRTIGPPHLIRGVTALW
jgi:hypothetical protein